jgi:small subunit ribosomal protein S9
MAVKAISAVGRRKTSSARVYLIQDKDVKAKKVTKKAKEAEAAETVEGTQDAEQATASILVNGLPFTEYFKRETSQMNLLQPLEMTERVAKYKFRVLVIGGGKSGQAGAVRHGISRVLEKVEPELRGILKKAGFLTRDSRVVERKKPGRHKARKRPQFSKR